MTAQADLVTSNSLLNFGDVPRDTSSSLSVEIINSGTVAVSEVVVSINGKSNYTVGTCPYTLFPGQTCSLIVTLDSKRYGTHNKTLSVSGIESTIDEYGDTNVVDKSVSVNLIGTSDNPNKP